MSHSITIESLDGSATLPVPHFATLHARLQQLEEENDTLRASKRDQETFVYAISHDLRAPLRAIDAFSRLLGDHLAQPLTPRARHDLAGIHAGIGRMQDLLNCWLNIARCERAVLRRTKVDLSVIAESLARELQMLDPKRSMIMTVDAELTADADPVLVRELLQNLLSNAWKFTDESTPATVHVGTRVENGGTVFYVRDNGIGFDSAHAAELFVPFNRLSTATRFAGTGVGLAIAQHIVERHQGRIWAEGELGRGATFFFTLAAAPQFSA
jgi:signal transduction histidine kinase